jgi:hypothetical protein
MNGMGGPLPAYQSLCACIDAECVPKLPCTGTLSSSWPASPASMGTGEFSQLAAAVCSHLTCAIGSCCRRLHLSANIALQARTFLQAPAASQGTRTDRCELPLCSQNPGSVDELLERRRMQQARYDAGEVPAFLPQTLKVGSAEAGEPAVRGWVTQRQLTLGCSSKLEPSCDAPAECQPLLSSC